MASDSKKDFPAGTFSFLDAMRSNDVIVL